MKTIPKSVDLTNCNNRRRFTLLSNNAKEDLLHYFDIKNYRRCGSETTTITSWFKKSQRLQIPHVCPTKQLRSVTRVAEKTTCKKKSLTPGKPFGYFEKLWNSSKIVQVLKHFLTSHIPSTLELALDTLKN